MEFCFLEKQEDAAWTFSINLIINLINCVNTSILLETGQNVDFRKTSEIDFSSRVNMI